MKKKKNTMYRKSVSLIAAAAMTAVLMAGQVYPVIAYSQGITSEIEKSTIIPENITIDEPVELSEVSLPKSEYGTLSWADDSYIPQKRIQSCEVVFKPAADIDLSYMSGWDAKEKVIKGKITVVVNSLEESDEVVSSDEIQTEEPKTDEGAESIPEDQTGEEVKEGNGEKTEDIAEEDKQESTEDIAEEDKQESTEDIAEEDKQGSTGDITEEDKQESAEDIAEEDKQESAEDIAEEDKQESAEGIVENKPESVEDIVEEDKSETEDIAEISEPLTTINPNADENENNENADSADVVVEPGKLNDAFGEAMPGATVLDGDENKNIFDNPLDFMTSSERPNSVTENLTEEEQAEIATQNHSCQGISVSGVDLPWYVQFQVTSGEDYEFKNEDKASIFQSYEFKLWDLKNNTEYEIPDGQYVSVTIPVKEGYEYSIEHLLDNGAVETIVPSVNGSTMIFSTHSFSPFGIAGFRPIIGDEIANGAYGENVTPTPTPTVTISGTPTPSSSVTGTAGNSGTSGNDGNGTTGNNNTTGNAGNGTTGNNNTTGNAGSGTTGNNNTTGNNGSGTTGNNSASGNNGSDTAGNNDASGNTGNSIAGNGSFSGNSGNAVNTNGSGTTGNNSQNQTSNAVQTGDNTVILPFVILVAAAVVVIIVVVLIRKKKDQ